MGLGSINEQINYSNYKRYGNYSVTQTNPFWNKRDSELTFNVYIRQVEDSIQIINSTTDPLTFFYRFDFVIKRYIDLCNMSRYIKSKRDFIKETKNLINLKSQYVQSLIIRVYKKSSEKVLSLKTEKGKINHVKKIEDSFLPFHDEMTNENLIFLNSVIEKLKSGNDLGNIPAPPIINNSPVTQVENNMKNKSNLPIIITIVVLLLFSCCCCGSIGGSKDKDDENSSQAEITTTVQIEGTTTVTTAEKTTSTKKTTTAQKTTTIKTNESIKTTNTELLPSPKLKILTIKDHPKLFGSVESAKNTWNTYLGEESVMIKDAIGYHYTYEDAVLVLDCYERKGAFSPTDSNIRGISIRFYNFNKDSNVSNYSYNNDVSFEQGLDIAKEYFPRDIILEHYTLNESFYQISENGKVNYSTVYKLNDDSESDEYSYWVSVVINTNELGNMDSLKLLCERIGDSRFESEKFEWNYDFLSENPIESTKITTVTTTEVTEPPTTEKSTELPTEPPTPAPTNPPTSPLAEPKVIKFILNVESGCVHTSSNCNAAEKILPENYAEIEIAEDELVNYAYTYWACGKCSKCYSNELPKF